MRIAVRYCGGCFAQYDRRDIGRMLERDFPDIEFLEYSSDVCADAIICVSGCGKNCAALGEMPPSRLGRPSICAEGDYPSLKEKVARVTRRAVD